MCFVCDYSARPRCKSVHFHLCNLKTWDISPPPPYYRRRKEQSRFNLRRGSGSWKHFTSREQIWYPSGSQGPERWCCQKKKSNAALFAIPTPISHHCSNFFFLIVSLFLSFFFIYTLLPPPSPHIPVNRRRSTWSYETHTTYTYHKKGANLYNIIYIIIYFSFYKFSPRQ